MGHLPNAGVERYHYTCLVGLLHGTVLFCKFMAPGYKDLISHCRHQHIHQTFYYIHSPTWAVFTLTQVLKKEENI